MPSKQHGRKGQEVILLERPMDGNVAGGLPKNTRLESGLKNELSKKNKTESHTD